MLSLDNNVLVTNTLYFHNECLCSLFQRNKTTIPNIVVKPSVGLLCNFSFSQQNMPTKA